MTPLPINPKVAILLNDNHEVVGVTSNIASTPDLEVIVTHSQQDFNDLALGNPFADVTPPLVLNLLSSLKSK